MPSNWYYEHKGIRRGPVNDEEIHRLHIRGRIRNTTQICNPGLSPQWRTFAEAVSDLPPPPLARPVSDILAWIIALAPPLLILIAPNFSVVGLSLAYQESSYSLLGMSASMSAGHQPAAIPRPNVLGQSSLIAAYAAVYALAAAVLAFAANVGMALANQEREARTPPQDKTGKTGIDVHIVQPDH